MQRREFVKIGVAAAVGLPVAKANAANPTIELSTVSYSSPSVLVSSPTK